MRLKVVVKWIDALESGKYVKGKGQLYGVNNEGFKTHCALGVLCEVAKKDGVTFEVDNHTNRLPLPVMEWAGLNYTDPRNDAGISVITLNDEDGTSFKGIAEFIEKNHESF